MTEFDLKEKLGTGIGHTTGVIRAEPSDDETMVRLDPDVLRQAVDVMEDHGMSDVYARTGTVKDYSNDTDETVLLFFDRVDGELAVFPAPKVLPPTVEDGESDE